MLIEEVEKYVVKFFEEGASHLIYHDLNHTTSVVRKVEEACTALNLNESDTLIITVAAWFHDIGYINNYPNHEYQSVIEFQKYVQSLEETDSEINERIIGCIRATRMEVVPRTELEAILKDVDIAYALYTDFQSEGEKLRKEIEKIKNSIVKDDVWEESQRQFLEKIKFTSQYGRNNFQALLDLELNK